MSCFVQKTKDIPFNTIENRGKQDISTLERVEMAFSDILEPKRILYLAKQYPNNNLRHIVLLGFLQLV